jgi:CRP-like cAMP-binding protein
MGIESRDLHLLRRCYLFAGMEEAAYQEVVEHAGVVELAAGQALFQQGQPITAIFWVVEGMIRLYRVSPQGEEKVIDLVGAGRSFAEAALFMGGHYPVCALAQIASRLIAIDAVHFKGWLAQDTQRCFRLMAAMSARMHKLLNDIDQLTLMKGTDRLLQYLLDHSDPDEQGRQVVELEAPKLVIASRLGIKPETFSRLLHKLVEQGCIEVQENRIYLLDPERMRQGRSG